METYNSYETYIMLKRDKKAEALLEMDVSEARERFADTVNTVAYGRRRIVLRKHGRPAVAIISLADLARLEELENYFEGQLAKQALAEKKRVPLDAARRRRKKRRAQK